MNILFFDTETTGLPKNWNAPVEQLDNWPRLVQIAWQVYNSNGELLEEHEYIIKPIGFIIPSEASAVHKITTEKALETGVDLLTILKVFSSSVKSCGLMVAHNYSYDYNIMGSELLRNDLENSLKDKEQICTMKASTEFCKIPGPYGYKWPKLEELYKILFNESFNAHNALDDIRATARCFWKLSSLKVIELPIFHQEKNNDLPYPDFKVNIISSLDYLNSNYYQLISESLSIISNLSEKQRDYAYQKISKVLIKKGLKDKAFDIVSKIKSQLLLDQVVYRDLSKVVMNRGEKEEALRIISLIKNRFWKESAHNELALILFKHGKRTEAIELASKYGSIEDFYSEIAPILMKFGEEEKALWFISKIKFDDYCYIKAIVGISKILMKRGYMDKALDFISKIEIDENHGAYMMESKDSFYADASVMFIKCGNIDNALKMASFIELYVNKQIAYAKICALIMERGNLEEALNVASKQNDNYYFSNSVEPYITITKILIEQGKLERAMSVASEIKNLEIRSHSYISICKFLLKNGFRKQAEIIAEKQELNDQFSETYSMALIKQGEIDEALNVVSNITNEAQKNYIYNKIAMKLMLMGREEKVISVNLLIKDNRWETEFYTQKAINIINRRYKARRQI